jgi:predicted metallopeptidase
MSREWTSAPDVEAIATRLIEILKPELEGFEIRYIMCNEPLKHGGQEAIALARKVVGLNAYLAGHPEGFFVIEVGPRFMTMNTDQKIAVIHHELCHLGINDEGGLTLIPHTIEEFVEVAAVHGAYHDGLVAFGHALQHASETTREEIKEKILNG